LVSEDKSISEVAKTFKVHKATVYRLLDKVAVNELPPV
jgi:transposase